jgi:hypothetical protein
MSDVRPQRGNMSFLGSVFAFLSPLPIPVLSIFTLLAVTMFTWSKPALVLLMGLAVVPVLALTLGPMVLSSSSGMFVLPWWATSLGQGRYFVWQ